MKNLKSILIVALIATVVVGIAAASIKPKRSSDLFCHNCESPRVIIENSAVHELALPETLEFYRSRKFTRFVVSTRENENGEVICDVVAIREF